MKLIYKKFGEGDPLIILHGLFGSLDNWQTIGKQFASMGFEVYLVDQRNHGHSPHSNQWDYDVMCDDLYELVTDSNLPAVSLIGHSMGGKTAMAFADKYPGKVNKLIIVDIAPKYYSVHHTQVIEALKAVKLDKISSRKEAEETLKKALLGDIVTQQFLLKNLYWLENKEQKLAWRFNLEVIANNIENVGQPVSVVNITASTLFIKGEKSDYISNNDIVYIQETIKNASVEIIKDAGHWIHAEKPVEFLACALRFLKG